MAMPPGLECPLGKGGFALNFRFHAIASRTLKLPG